MSTSNLTNYTYNELLAMLQEIDLRQADYETLEKASAILDTLFHGEKKYSTDELSAMSSQERALYDVLAAKVRSHYYDSLVEAAEGRLTNSQLQVFKERAGIATTALRKR